MKELIYERTRLNLSMYHGLPPVPQSGGWCAECCNYIDGNCIALDDGEECVCVQSISYSLLCRWFRTAILPQDKELETALFHGSSVIIRFYAFLHI